MLTKMWVHVQKKTFYKGWIWDLIVSVPDHCLSFYFSLMIDDLLRSSPE